MALATVNATLNGKQNGGKIKAIISDTNHWPRNLPRAPYSKRSSILYVVHPTYTTSSCSVKRNSSVHHVQRQTCVVTCGKNLFNKFNSFQTFPMQQKIL